jgi:Tol biopolymer transport system component
VTTRLTSDPARDQNPVWSPDGKWVAFASDREGGVFQIYRKDASGAGQEERLTDGPHRKVPYDWSRDGRYLLYLEQQGTTISGNLMALPLQGDRKPILVVEGVSPRSSAAISPDGRWVAYGSEFSGLMEVYVQAFPSPGAPQGRTQVSIAGGYSPKWRGDGKELYYRRGGVLAVAAIQAFPQGIRAEAPRELFNSTSPWNFEVTPDGNRFLLMMLGSLDTRAQKLAVVSHWQATLRR